jgi:Tol biopolymer transport system component
MLNYPFMLKLRNMTINKLIVLLLLTTACYGCLGKGNLPQPQAGDLHGRVIDRLTGEAAPGVRVTLGEHQLVTDLAGEFVITGLEPGDYTARFERGWYLPHESLIHYVGLAKTHQFSITSEPLSGSVLYSSDISGDREIYRLDLAARQIERLTELASSETNPAYLYPGRILFQSNNTTGQEDDLFCYDLSSQIKTPLCSSAYNDQHPGADYQGRRIVFQSMRGGSRQVYYYDLDSPGAPVVVAAGQNPALAPDGSRIAYIDGSYRLWIYQIGQPSNASNPRLIGLPGKANNPCWSPDGARLGFESWQITDGPRFIAMIEPGRNESPQQLTFAYYGKADHKHPCWSGDGQLLFFNSAILYSTRNDIYCIRVSEALQLKESAPWLMVSKGAGNKDYPVWGR